MKLGKRLKAQDACNILSLTNRDAETSQKAIQYMTSLPNYLSKVYSEELYAGISEADYQEVMQSSVTDYEGYAEWSEELEQGQRVQTSHVEILINRDCSHLGCKSTRCERDFRVGGIAI